MVSNDDTYEAEISSLFKDALSKLDKIDTQVQEDKKQIVKDLANNLEGKIPTDTISIEIVNQLHSRVSERFIHECLDDKYKQEYRVENARKQKKRQQNGNENLAALTPLAQETTVATSRKDLKKIVVDVNGRALEEKNKPTPPTMFPTNDNNSIAKTGEVLKSPQHGLNRQIKPDLECPRCQELYAEVTELKEALTEATTLQIADNMLTSSSSVSTIIESQVDFEFPLIFGKVRKHMESLYQNIGDGGKVWFSGRIDKKTGIVISARTGKIDQQNDLAGDTK